MRAVYRAFLCVTVAGGFYFAGSAFAAGDEQSTGANPIVEKKLLVNNDWKVEIKSDPQARAYVYVTLREVGDHWEIESLSEKKIDVLKASKLELFAVHPSLTHWVNVERDMVRDCAAFKSKYYSVCSSSLASEKTGLSVVGVLLGGSGSFMTGYVDEKVRAAINSIPPEQAKAKMKAFIDDFAENQRKIDEQKEIAAKEKQAAASKLLAEAKQMRSAARVGARDWCEQEVIYFDPIPGTFARPMQVSQSYKCFTFGVVDEAVLRAEGWTITNKQPKTVGTPPQLITVYDIGIEKIR